MLSDLLVRCAVRIETGSGYGSGVLVAPGQVLTCGHVVHPPDGAVRVVLADGSEHPAQVRQVLTPRAPGQQGPFPWPDLAWLSIEHSDHPVVQIDPDPPQYGTDGDLVWAYGHSRTLDSGQVRAQPGTYRVEGFSPEPAPLPTPAPEGLDGGEPIATGRVRWQLAAGQAAPGMSGAPLLNQRTGRVLGLLTRSRSRDTDLGGWAVPLRDALALLPDLAELISAADAGNSTWRGARWDALGLTRQLRPAAEPLPPPGRRPPGALLTARHAVVPFHPARQPDVDQLLTWNTDPTASPVRLVTGAAGTGKTRLAVQLCRQLNERGWLARFLPRDLPAGVPELLTGLTTAGDPTLLVVDYAETRADLPALLDSLADLALDEERAPLRVLLLARQAGDWWTQLTTAGPHRAQQLLAGTLLAELGQVPGPPKDLTSAYHHALTALTAAQQVPPPADPPRLADEPWTYLRLHMAALTALPTPGSSAADGDVQAAPLGGTVTPAEALRAVAERERGYWRTAASRDRMPAEISDNTVLARAVVTLSLLPARTETEAAQLLRRVPDLDSDSLTPARRQLARWTRRHYPPPRDEPIWTAGMQPDLLAQHLTVTTLTSDPDLVPALLTDLADAQAEQPLTILTRACRHEADAPRLLDQALAADLDHLALPALRVAAQTGDPLGQILTQHLHRAPQATLEQLDQAMPVHTVALREAAAAVTHALAEAARIGDDQETLARYLNDLSNRLADLGRLDDALDAIEEAVTHYRALATAHPDHFTSQFAMALNNLANRLGEVERHGDALAAASEATTLYRSLAVARREDFTPLLAMALNNLSIELAAEHRQDEALAAIEEAVAIRRPLAAAHPDAYASDLASSLNNLALRLSEVDRHEEALTAIQETVTLYRQLTTARPDAFTLNLAMSLNNAGNRLSRLGQDGNAVDALREAVKLFRALATTRPDLFGPYLAKSLSNLAKRLRKLERHEDALTAIEEEVNLHRELARARPDAFSHELAASLHHLALQLADLSRHDDAREARREARDLLDPPSP